ncbi:histidinol-phosphate aminotransferase [Betaproteobacteria bacterium]|nr:histidinol-phosphate aminotransferase [Betaproteobacteria bacterium]
MHGLKPYSPGEQPRLTQLIKLNTNENPYPPSPQVVAAIRAALGEEGAILARYPDPVGDKLKAAIIRFYAPRPLRPQQIFVGNSSDEVLSTVFQALFRHSRPLLFPDVTYSFYPSYCGLYDITYEQVPVDEDFSIRVEDYQGKANGGIIFPNPNAPSGRALPISDIERIVSAHPQSVVVVDEAYVDFGADTAIGLTHRYPNLLVVQTLSKSRALAGLRVGFAVGHPDLIEALERVKNCFNSYLLDHLALAGAAAALDDVAWFEQNRQKIIMSREDLSVRLGELGFQVIPSQANFIFAHHPDHAAETLAQQLRERRIIVRHFKQPRIDGYLRISIGTPEECAALVDALQQIVG